MRKKIKRLKQIITKKESDFALLFNCFKMKKYRDNGLIRPLFAILLS